MRNRLGFLAGPAAVILWIVGIALVNHNGPADKASGAQILSWYKSDTNWILLGSWLFMLGCLCFICFAAALRGRLVGVAGPGSSLPSLVFVGAALAAAFGMLTTGPDVAGALNKSHLEAPAADAFHHLTDAFFVAAELAAILPLAAVAIAAWRTRFLPRWWAGFAALVAIILVIGPIGWAGLIFGVPLWTLGTSVLLLLRRGEPAAVAPAAA
jgi:hypothetical protein